MVTVETAIRAWVVSVTWVKSTTPLVALGQRLNPVRIGSLTRVRLPPPGVTVTSLAK